MLNQKELQNKNVSENLLFENASKEMNATEQLIREYILKNRIDCPNLIRSLDECKIAQGYLAGQNLSLKVALSLLIEIGHANFAHKFGTVTTKKNITEPAYESIISDNLDCIDVDKLKTTRLQPLKDLYTEALTYIQKNNFAKFERLPVEENLKEFQVAEAKCLASKEIKEVDHYLKFCHLMIYGALVQLARYDQNRGSNNIAFFEILGVIKEEKLVYQWNFAPSFYALKD